MGVLVPQVIATGPATVTLEDDGIAVVRFELGATVSGDDMRGILAAQRTLGAHLVLVDARPVKEMSREAQVLSANEGVEGTRAVAILVEGPTSTLLGNFFLRLTRPPYATRLFRDDAAARNWLHEHAR